MMSSITLNIDIIVITSYDCSIKCIVQLKNLANSLTQRRMLPSSYSHWSSRHSALFGTVSRVPGSPCWATISAMMPRLLRKDLREPTTEVHGGGIFAAFWTSG